MDHGTPHEIYVYSSVLLVYYFQTGNKKGNISFTFYILLRNILKIALKYT